MNATSFVIGDELKDLSENFVFFSNLRLKHQAVEDLFDLLATSLRHGLDSYYKTQTQISYHSLVATEKQILCEYLQFSDVVVRFRHVDLGFEFFLTMGSNFARSLLCKLLSTTLIDDSLGLLFSDTEKGILSFIIAKLLYEMKPSASDKIANIKLLGVYNSQDPDVAKLQSDNHGLLNFSIFLTEQRYPMALIVPAPAMQNINIHHLSRDRLFSRCGFLQRPFCLRISTMSIRLKTLKCLSFGDVIILDNFKPDYENGVLSGHISAQWDEYFLGGEIVSHDGRYMFSPKASMLWAQKEDAQVEEVQILDAKNHGHIDQLASNGSKFAHLANNIRVQLNIELARLPLTLKEVCELREGSIIDLKRKLDDPLALVVEGRVIGHCTPVKIDGRLGIKILQLLDQDSLQS